MVRAGFIMFKGRNIMVRESGRHAAPAALPSVGDAHPVRLRRYLSAAVFPLF